jgi:hypothetical protein
VRLGAALLFALCLFTLGSPRSAHAQAQGQLVTGLDAAFTIDALIGAGSVVSIVGNSVTLAKNKPQRGWMYSGFILGTANLAAGLITIFFGGDPVVYGNDMTCMDRPSGTTNPCGPKTPEIQYGLGIAQTILGAANLGLAIRSAVIWHRLREQEAAAAAPPPSALSRLRITPTLGRDLGGAAQYGVAISLGGL